MENTGLRVRMLGDFVLTLGDRSICSGDNRSRKVWLILAYLIYFRERSVSKKELLDRFWEDSESSADPLNALKAVLHRARTMLNELGPDCGKRYILYHQGEYKWNTEEEIHLDVEEFEQMLLRFRAEQDEDQRLRCGMAAAELYRGEFLDKLGGEPWVFPLSAYFHRSYLELLQGCLEMLSSRGRTQDIIALTRQAITVEPCDETLYYYLMRALLDQGDHQAVRTIYDSMSAALFSRLGIMPSDEIRTLYREAMRATSETETDLSSVLEDLREPTGRRGAFLCDYDFFKTLYQVEARSISRNGDAVHICLISASGSGGKHLPKRSLDLCIENLRSVIVRALRSGDVVSRCSPSQFVIMLPHANYENSCMIMDRILRSFNRQFPHSPATLQYMVQPLTPWDS